MGSKKRRAFTTVQKKPKRGANIRGNWPYDPMTQKNSTKEGAGSHIKPKNVPGPVKENGPSKGLGRNPPLTRKDLFRRGDQKTKAARKKKKKAERGDFKQQSPTSRRKKRTLYYQDLKHTTQKEANLGKK